MPEEELGSCQVFHAFCKGNLFLALISGKNRAV